MAKPRSKKEFAEYCLRALGKPAVEINVDIDQVDDRIDEALQYYYDYHYDGSEKVYYKHQVTQQNITDGFIQVPENIMGIVSIFDFGGSFGGGGMFSPQYQFALENMHALSSGSIVPYVMSMQYMQMLQDILVGLAPIRFNRHVNKLHIDTNWSKVQVGQYIVVEAYQVIDPEAYTDVWGDRWLHRYATALIGVQWATNLSKFTGMTLPGGIQFNAADMMARYSKAQSDLEAEMISSFSLPVCDMIG